MEIDMKRIFALAALLSSGLMANAQYHYQDAVNPEISRHMNQHKPSRKEIVLPQVNGYNVYKADLHTHTIFSDGVVLPDFRVKEAWLDGLDVMAVTEHVEYRPHEETMGDYMVRYMDGNKVKNNKIGAKAPDADGIMVDLNASYERAMKSAPGYGLVLIKGAEITRDGKTVGHFNALFTEDNNKIYDPDPVKSVRNAKAQGALVMHNHPGWRKTDINLTKTEAAVYGEGLVDGAEVMNTAEFYPEIVDRVQKYGQFIAANSDIHATTAADYTAGGNFRPMTFILAKDKSLASLKEALQARRTLAYGYNTLCGTEELLTDFFKAAVTLTVISEKDSKGRVVTWLTNNTSLEYHIQFEGENIEYIAPFSTVLVKGKFADRKMTFKVVNMFCGKNTHPKVTLEF